MIAASLLMGLGTLVLTPGADTVVTAPDESVSVPAPVPDGTGGPDTNAIAGSLTPPSIPADPDYLPGPIDFITNLPGDWGGWAVNTINISNAPVIAGIGVATAGLVQIDEHGYRTIRKEYDGSTDFRRFCDGAVLIGDGTFQFGVAALFGAYGFIAGDNRAIRTASQVTEVILACGGVVQLVKHLTGRQRPSAATSPTGRWALFPNPIEYQRHVPRYDAFPSGHLSTATATLTVIMQNYPELTWLPWVGYPVLGALGIGLVSSGMHWWSDFPLALALGYSFGKIVGSRRSDRRDLPEMESYDVREHGPTPCVALLSDGSPAVGVQWRW